MEKPREIEVWQDTVYANPSLAACYALSCNQLFDAMSTVFDQRTNSGHKILTDAELLALSGELDAMIDEYDTALSGRMLHVQGRGMYYPEVGETIEFIDNTYGISGNFDGVRIEELPLYHDLVYKNNTNNRQVLSIALENYAQQNVDNSVGIPHNTSAIVPIVGQDLCISRYVTTMAE